MRIAFLSCFYPYRGGIAQFSDELFAELSKSHTVKAFNYSRQYPGLLFPGKTQYVENPGESRGERLLDSINPFSWMRCSRAIREWNPDVLIVSWWMSFFGPSLGSVVRSMPDNIKVIALVHNAIPHEKRFFDIPLTRYFMRGCDAAVALSDAVSKDIDSLTGGKLEKLTLFHPIYSNFGAPLSREEALRHLGIPDDGRKNLLFFGLIREYKGLDLLLEAFSRLDDSYRLIVAGEPYGSFEKYQSIIDASPAKERISLHLKYIADAEVKYFFCASDLVTLPYRSATQSGISAIALHFERPMLVTDVGGLKNEIGECGVVVPAAEPAAIAEGIKSYFDSPETATACQSAIVAKRDALSWQTFAVRLEEMLKR